MPHVIANFAFEAQSLFFGCFGEFSLKGIFLSAVSLFFSCVGSLSMSQSSSLSSLVKRYTVNLMNFTFWTVSLDFFRNVHVLHYQLCIEGTYAFLYFFTFQRKKTSRKLVEPLTRADWFLLQLCDMLNFDEKAHSFLNRTSF